MSGILRWLDSNTVCLEANIILYGSAASKSLSEQMADEISTMWTEPKGSIIINNQRFTLVVATNSIWEPHLSPETVLNNRNPAFNFFRVEHFVNGNISFVDAINSNTGMFKLDNLYEGSTTAAHEFGHTIGLQHPSQLDLRGRGIPGIMYPRGTLVDAQYQYSPDVAAGSPGGTMHPKFRKVWKEEIAMLRINTRLSNNYMMVIGDLSNVWHESHDIFNV